VVIPAGHTTYSAIHREWDPDEIGRCTLCPKCYSHDGRSCLIAVNKHVSAEDAYLFDAATYTAGEKPPSARQ
jgi:hypothetical protein